MRRISTIAKTSISVLALSAMSLSTSASADRIRVELNGETVRFYGTQPRQVDGRVMVPLRGVLEKMGATVDWVDATRTVMASKGDMELELPIGSRNAKVNDRTVRLDVPAMTMAGSTMVPLRFVSEALGADVAWSSRSQTVMIGTDGRIARNDRDFDRDIDTQRANRNARRFSRASFVPVGTVIPVTLDEALRSDEANEGDRFTATIQAGRDDAGLPSGTKFEGVVTEALESKGSKPGVLAVSFRRVIFPDGTEKAIEGRVVSLESKNLTRDDEGRLVAKGGSRNDEQLKWVGIGAGAGLLISTLTKGNALVDTILGAGAGYLYNQLQRKGAGNVNLKSGAELGVKLDTRLPFTRAEG
jgi:hypothetical protein